LPLSSIAHAFESKGVGVGLEKTFPAIPDFNAPKRVEFIFALCYAQSMQITVQLPDDLASHPNPGREALEALAIEGYRDGILSHFQASQLLGLSRFEFDGFLKDRQIYDHAYDVEDLEQDIEAMRQLQAEGLLRA
jgi:predicted HTH domain antitoxin